jgi:hypothetical protein
MSTPKRPWNGTVPQILIGLLLAGLIVAVIEANSDYDEDCGWSFIGTTVAHWGGGDHHRIRIGRGRCRVDLELEGEIDFAADNRGVERLGSGASLSIKERRRGETRRLDVERGRDGQPVYSWWVGRVPRDFDDEARAWLADTLPRLYRTTGLDADGRVEALWAAGGFDAVAAEIRELDSDHVRVLYLRELLARSTADDELVGASTSPAARCRRTTRWGACSAASGRPSSGASGHAPPGPPRSGRSIRTTSCGPRSRRSSCSRNSNRRCSTRRSSTRCSTPRAPSAPTTSRPSC